MRTTFLVGRLTPKSAEMVVVEEGSGPSFPGPWRLRALVRPFREPSPASLRGGVSSTRVH